MLGVAVNTGPPWYSMAGCDAVAAVALPPCTGVTRFGFTSRALPVVLASSELLVAAHENDRAARPIAIQRMKDSSSKRAPGNRRLGAVSATGVPLHTPRSVGGAHLT